MTKFHCNCGATITGTKRDIATHLSECATIRENAERAEATRQPRKAKTKSGFHLNQIVQIITNWRTEQPDGRIGTICKIRRAYHGVGGSDVSTALEIEVNLGNGQWHKTFPKYLKAIEVCRECGRPMKLQDGLCFDCWRYQEGVSIDYRSQDQRHLDTLS